MRLDAKSDKARLKKPITVVAVLAMLIACSIVLSRILSIATWNIRIGFNFIPIVIAGILYGPIGAGVVAATSDFLGAILFPFGAYFPGFTVTALVNGVIFGIFLYKKQTSTRIISSVVLSQVVCSLILNTLWITILNSSPFLAVLSTRLLTSAVMTVVQIVVIGTLVKVLVPQLKTITA